MEAQGGQSQGKVSQGKLLARQGSWPITQSTMTRWTIYWPDRGRHASRGSLNTTVIFYFNIFLTVSKFRGGGLERASVKPAQDKPCQKLYGICRWRAVARPGRRLSLKAGGQRPCSAWCCRAMYLSASDVRRQCRGADAGTRLKKRRLSRRREGEGLILSVVVASNLSAINSEAD